MASEVKLMECKSCGAHFDEMLPECPYCGTMSIKGAQKEYMDKLEDIRSDVEDLSAVPAQVTKKELKKQTKIILWALGICGALLLLCVLIEVFFGYKPQERDEKADYLWLQENIPLLEELYEQEQYEELMKKVNDAYENNEPVWQWEHRFFCDYLDFVLKETELLEKEASGQVLENGDYEWLLYLHCRTSQIPESTILTEEEMEKLMPMVEVLNADYEARWHFTAEEQAILDATIQENAGFVDFDTIEVVVKMWMERNNK